VDATAELTQALAEWRRLTDAEREAIVSDNWNRVAEQQDRKKQLQAQVQHTLALARALPAAGTDSSWAPESELDSVIGELIAMERHNAELIVAKRSRRQAEAARMTRTLLDLQGVRRAYGSSRGPHWQSYS
jgi:hypothetical protein